MVVENEVVAEYATRRNLPPGEARMLDRLRFRGQFPFGSVAEVHGFYETLRMIVSPGEVRPLPERDYSYSKAE